MEEWKRFTNWWTSGGAPIFIGVVVAAVFVAAVVIGGASYIIPRLPGKQPSYVTAAEERGDGWIDILGFGYNEEEGTLIHIMLPKGNPSARQLQRAGPAVDRAIRSHGTEIGPSDHGAHIYIYVDRGSGLRLNSVNHCDWDGTMNSTVCTSQLTDTPDINPVDVKWRNKTSK